MYSAFKITVELVELSGVLVPLVTGMKPNSYPFAVPCAWDMGSDG